MSSFKKKKNELILIDLNPRHIFGLSKSLIVYNQITTMSNQDDLIADMGALMSRENDLQNDLPLFQPSEVKDPEERIKVD